MPHDAPQSVPSFQYFFSPIVDVLRATSDSGPMTIAALDAEVAKQLRLSDDVLSVMHDPEHKDQSEVCYRMAWARTYLKKVGLIDNPTRGTWCITELGRRAGKLDANAVVKRVRSASDADVDATAIPEYLANELIAIHRAVLTRERPPVGEALDACYQRFRARFGPDALRKLDGEQLLATMQGRQGNKSSLVYWLEFKDDDELPRIFGSIAGGSPLKFGIYQSNDTGEWITGVSRNQRVCLSRRSRRVRANAARPASSGGRSFARSRPVA